MALDPLEDLRDEEVVVEARKVAKDLVDTAMEASASMIEDSDRRATKTLANALREVFGENQKTGRFVDVSRVPLICQNITGIHDSLKEMKDMINNFNDSHVSNEVFWPVKTIVYSGVGLVLVAIVGAVTALILK